MHLFSGSSKWLKTPVMYHVELISIEQLQSELLRERGAAPSIKKETSPKKVMSSVPAADQKSKQTTPAETKQQPTPEQAVSTQSSTTRIAVDGKEFPYAYYINLLYNRLQENWQPPYQMDQRSQPLRVLVAFRILRDGKITDLGVESSSGRFIFDRAALRAVLGLSPLPPLPQQFGNHYLSVHIEFEETR